MIGSLPHTREPQLHQLILLEATYFFRFYMSMEKERKKNSFLIFFPIYEIAMKTIKALSY